MLYASILRSPHAHAKIVDIDTSKAQALSGVVAVYTGRDLEGKMGTIPTAWRPPDSNIKTVAHHAIATDKVRYVGDAVAVVVAEDRYAARDAVDAIRVGYEVLPATADQEKAMQDSAAQLHEEAPNNIAFHWKVGNATDDVFDKAEVVVKHQIRQQRLVPNPMKPRAAVAQYDDARGDMTIWCTSQNPHIHADIDGVGTYESRSTPVGGSALAVATDRVIEKATKIAAHMLEASEEDIEFVGGKFQPKGVPSRNISFHDVTLQDYLAWDLPQGVKPALEGNSFYDPANFTYSFGTHLALVEVDKDTGEVHLRRYIAVDDCGRVLNPMIAEGQVHGGVVQGIGQALYEGAVYDENAQLVTGTLMDYALPKARFFPQFETAFTETPSPHNPLGVKSIGETGTIASTPTVVNAVIDAVQPFGVTDIDMPLTPERVWRAMQISQAGGRS